jgi:hypothetical protein
LKSNQMCLLKFYLNDFSGFQGAFDKLLNLDVVDSHIDLLGKKQH